MSIPNIMITVSIHSTLKAQQTKTNKFVHLFRIGFLYVIFKEIVENSTFISMHQESIIYFVIGLYHSKTPLNINRHHPHHASNKFNTSTPPGNELMRNHCTPPTHGLIFINVGLNPFELEALLLRSLLSRFVSPDKARMIPPSPPLKLFA